MKKSLTLAVLALSTLGMVSCNQTASSGNSGSENTGKKETITLQFVPSNDAQTVLTRAKQLEPFFEKICPEYNFEMNVGTNYAVVNTALANGQIDGGFLTASGYAQESIENPGKVELLLSAARAARRRRVLHCRADTAETPPAFSRLFPGTCAGDGSAVASGRRTQHRADHRRQSAFRDTDDPFCSAVAVLRSNREKTAPAGAAQEKGSRRG